MADQPADDGDGASARILALPCAVSSRIVAAIFSYFNGIINSCSRSRIDSGLPLPPTVNIMVMGDLYPVTEKVVQSTLLLLHCVQNNLRCWQQSTNGGYSVVVSNMEFQDSIKATPPISRQNPIELTDPISRLNIDILEELRFALATFLSMVYVEIDEYGKKVSSVTAKKALLLGLGESFLYLERSISDCTPSEFMREALSLGYTLDGRSPAMTDFDMHASVNMILSKQRRLDKFLTFVLAKCSKPRNKDQQCISYPCAFGAMAFSILAIWVVRHSNISFKQILEQITPFFRCYVVQPISRLRDELFKKEEQQIMQIKQVEETSNLLHKLLLKLSLRTTGQESLDKQVFDTAMDRFVKQVKYPLRNLLFGDLTELTIIQVQRLKLEFERAGVYMNHKVVNPNELSYAFIWTLPTIYLPVHLLAKLRACINKQIAIAECEERRQNNALFEQVRKAIEQCMHIPQNRLLDMRAGHGLIMYSLDRLYKAVKVRAKAAGEWPRLREDMVMLQQLSYEVREFNRLEPILSYMEKEYSCLQ